MHWTSWSERGWTTGRFCMFSGLLWSVVLVTLPAWQDIARIAAQRPGSRYILLVPVAAAMLCWVRRGRLRQCVLRHSWLGLALAILGCVLYRLGNAERVVVFFHSGAVIALIGVILQVAGPQVIWRFLPGFIALAFLVPVPPGVHLEGHLPLQSVIAEGQESTASMVSTDSVPADRLHVVGATRATDPLEQVLLLGLTALLFAFVKPFRFYVRCLLLTLMPACALLCNEAIVLVTRKISNGANGMDGLVKDREISLGALLAFLLLAGCVRLMPRGLIPVGRYRLASNGC